jgi:SAM-dependent methyltransferase
MFGHAGDGTSSLAARTGTPGLVYADRVTHDRDRFSLIGHAAMPFMCPLTEPELVALVEAADLSAGARALDAGGGRGDLAALLARRFGCSVAMVDRSPAACDQARLRTAGLEVTVHCEDAVAHVRAASPGSFALGCAVGAIHAFGAGRDSWAQAVDALGRASRRVLVADLVALGPHAADSFEIARLDSLTLADRAIASVVLPQARVAAYERAWADGLRRHLDAHPDDPRADWAESRIAWTNDPSLRTARDELAFAAFVI